MQTQKLLLKSSGKIRANKRIASNRGRGMPELPGLESRLQELGLEKISFTLQLPYSDLIAPDLNELDLIERDLTEQGVEDAKYRVLRQYLGTRNILAATAIDQVNATTREVAIQAAVFVGTTPEIAVCGQDGSINRGPTLEQFARDLSELMHTEVTLCSDQSQTSGDRQTLWIGHGRVPKTPLRIAAALSTNIECGVSGTEHAFFSSTGHKPIQVSGFGDLESYPVLAFVKTSTQRRIELTLDDSLTPHIVVIHNQEFEAVPCAVSAEHDAQVFEVATGDSIDHGIEAHKLLEALVQPAFLEWADTIPSKGVSWITQKEEDVYTRGLEKYHLLHREAAKLVTVPKREFFVTVSRLLGSAPQMQELVQAFENGSTTPFEDAGIESSSLAFSQGSRFKKDVRKASLNSILNSYDENGRRRSHWWQRAFHSPKIRWPLAMVFMCSGVFLAIDAIDIFGPTATPISQSVLRSVLCFCVGAQILGGLIGRRRINKSIESMLKGNNEQLEN